MSARQSRPSARPAVRRGATVSLAALALCTASAGVASAATSPLPPVPDPGDTLTTLQQTVTGTVQQVTGTQPSSSPTPVPTPTTTSVTSLLPGNPATTSTGSGSTSTTSTTKHVAAPSHPTVHLSHHSTAPAAQPAASGTTSYAAAAGFDMSALGLPPQTSLAAAPGDAPAVAPAAQAPVTIRPAANANALDDVTNHKGSPVRGLLLALAAAAAGALTIEHLRQASRRLAE